MGDFSYVRIHLWIIWQEEFYTIKITTEIILLYYMMTNEMVLENHKTVSLEVMRQQNFQFKLFFPPNIHYSQLLTSNVSSLNAVS
jgi:hypothetical protein